MKDRYITPENIDLFTKEMLNELAGKHYRAKPWKLSPKKAALLVLDMQNYFLDPASHAFTPSAPTIIPNMNRLIEMAENNSMEIIFTKHVNDRGNAAMMGKWWKDMVAEGSYEAEIFREVCGRRSAVGDRFGEEGMQGWEECKVILKHQYDAFYNTDLEGYLRSKNIGQVIITGVLTNLCCETTARSAFVRGFEVLFPIDATAAYNREFHYSTFRNLGYGFCPFLTSAELINSFEK